MGFIALKPDNMYKVNEFGYGVEVVHSCSCLLNMTQELVPVLSELAFLVLQEGKDLVSGLGC